MPALTRRPVPAWWYDINNEASTSCSTTIFHKFYTRSQNLHVFVHTKRNCNNIKALSQIDHHTTVRHHAKCTYTPIHQHLYKTSTCNMPIKSSWYFHHWFSWNPKLDFLWAFYLYEWCKMAIWITMWTVVKGDTISEEIRQWTVIHIKAVMCGGDSQAVTLRKRFLLLLADVLPHSHCASSPDGSNYRKQHTSALKASSGEKATRWQGSTYKYMLCCSVLGLPQAVNEYKCLPKPMKISSVQRKFLLFLP